MLAVQTKDLQEKNFTSLGRQFRDMVSHSSQNPEESRKRREKQGVTSLYEDYIDEFADPKAKRRKTTKAANYRADQRNERQQKSAAAKQSFDCRKDVEAGTESNCNSKSSISGDCYRTNLPDFAELRPVPADGSCFFHCIGNFLGISSIQVREEILTFASANHDKYEKYHFISKKTNNMTFKEYIEEMHVDTSLWANNSIIMAAQNYYNININIIFENTDKPIRCIEHNMNGMQLYNRTCILHNKNNIHFSNITLHPDRTWQHLKDHYSPKNSQELILPLQTTAL